MARRGQGPPVKALSAEAKQIRARSLPSRQPYDRAVVASMLHYLGLITTVTAFVCYFIQPNVPATHFIVGGILFSALSWLVAFFQRRSTICPLCKGTPLIDSGARTHKRSVRIFPFNYGTTAILSIIATQRFRCMYCGSDYDLLKIPSHLHTGGKMEE